VPSPKLWPPETGRQVDKLKSVARIGLDEQNYRTMNEASQIKLNQGSDVGNNIKSLSLRAVHHFE
jgi:hypothetical protein